MANEFQGRWNDFFIASDVDGIRKYDGVLEIDAEVDGKFNGKRVKATGPINFTGGVCRLIGGDIIVRFQITDGDFIYVFRGVVNRPAGPRRVEGMYWAFKKDDAKAALNTDPGDTGGWGGNQGT